MRYFIPFVLFFAGCASKPPSTNSAQTSISRKCGEVIQLRTHNDSTTRYALSLSPNSSRPATIIMMIGGGGRLSFDAGGCPTELSRNPLNRLVPLLAERGINVALMDAPSDYYDEEGLAGFRTHPKHAEDVSFVIHDIRSRTNGPVWVAGHSRGSISAANAGARLKGISGPDGIILMSMMLVGQPSRKRPHVAQTVFDPPLERIEVPALLLGNDQDHCVRSPASLAHRVLERISSKRKQLHIIHGKPDPVGTDECGAVAAHGFAGHDVEIADGFVRFIFEGSF